MIERCPAPIQHENGKFIYEFAKGMVIHARYGFLAPPTMINDEEHITIVDTDGFRHIMLSRCGIGITDSVILNLLIRDRRLKIVI